MASVTSTPSASAMICVQLTQHVADLEARSSVVGRTIERALSLQIHDIAPSRISASPSVAVGFDQRVAPRQRRPEQHAVEQRDGAAEADADEVGEPLRPAVVC